MLYDFLGGAVSMGFAVAAHDDRFPVMRRELG